MFYIQLDIKVSSVLKTLLAEENNTIKFMPFCVFTSYVVFSLFYFSFEPGGMLKFSSSTMLRKVMVSISQQ